MVVLRENVLIVIYNGFVLWLRMLEILYCEVRVYIEY